MASQPQPTRKQHLKLAIIPLLAGVLLWMVFGRSDKDKPTGAGAHGSSVASGSHKGSRKPVSRSRIERPWPEFELGEILLHDPFLRGEPQQADPAQTAVRAPAETEEEGEEIGPQEWEVDVFIDSKKRQIALSNGHVLQRGDVVEGKWRVLALSHEKVLLEPID